MLFHERFKLPGEDQHDVDSTWFERQKQRSVPSHDSRLRDWLSLEVDALKAFYDARINADEAALSMTHPVSVSPVPDLGGYSDDVLALGNLWRLIIVALIEWPSTLTPKISILLDAIAKTPGNIHKGEAVAEGKPLTWADFPYFGMMWHESTGADIQRGQIHRQYSDSPLGALQARTLYLKMKDIEAQLVAEHILPIKKVMVQRIMRTLEKNIDRSDEQTVSDEATGYDQVKLDVQIPAVSLMLKYNAREVYDRVVAKELGDWTKRQLPDGAREFSNGDERWSFWKRRLEELSYENSDDEVRAAARASLEYMSSGG
jgi:hypothetical protein